MSDTTSRLEKLMSTENGVGLLFDTLVEEYGKEDIIHLMIYDIPEEERTRLLKLASEKEQK